VLGNFGLPLGSHQVHTVFRVKASVSSAQIWRSPRFTRLQRCSRFGSRSERSVPTRFSRSLFLFSVAQAPVVSVSLISRSEARCRFCRRSLFSAPVPFFPARPPRSAVSHAGLGSFVAMSRQSGSHRSRLVLRFH
jgi:hypothetical protein